MTKPLELLGGRGPQDTGRVRCNSTDMKTHEITLKLQALSTNPLVTQIVVDAIPTLMLTGRQDSAHKLEQKPRPLAYLRFGQENITDELKFIKLVMVDYLVTACAGRVASTEALMLEVDQVTKQLKSEIAYAAQTALKLIAEAREGIVTQNEV